MHQGSGYGYNDRNQQQSSQYGNLGESMKACPVVCEEENNTGKQESNPQRKQDVSDEMMPSGAPGIYEPL
jgi:hypothetical protein